MLTPAVLARLKRCRSVLIAGAGGGYDVAGAIPLALALRERGLQVHFGSLSFSSLRHRMGLSPVAESPHLFEVTADHARSDVYCPEAWLSAWLARHQGWRAPVWCFEQCGVKPLRAAYQALVSRLQLDGVVLMDGGIDLILRGDETSIGTPAEDLASLSAVAGVDVEVKIVACVGFGAEIRNRICHAQVFERIAELSALGGYLGCSDLAGAPPHSRQYVECMAFVFDNQSAVKRSHVHAVVLRALAGEFGSNRGESDVWISPLLSIYWYFDLSTVADSHLFVAELEWTERLLEIVRYVEGLRRQLTVREPSRVPI